MSPAELKLLTALAEESWAGSLECYAITDAGRAALATPTAAEETNR